MKFLQLGCYGYLLLVLAACSPKVPDTKPTEPAIQETVEAGKTQLKVMSFGNSTTAALEELEFVYTDLLEEILSRDQFDATCINQGIPGSHSGRLSDNDFYPGPHALDRFRDSVLVQNPDWVIVAFGLNDSWVDSGQENGPARISLAAFQQNLRSICQQIQTQNGKVLLLTPNPPGSKFADWRRARTEKYADAVRELALELNLGMVDSWALFSGYDQQADKSMDDLLLPDGIHPNEKAHQMLAEQIGNVIAYKTLFE